MMVHGDAKCRQAATISRKKTNAVAGYTKIEALSAGLMARKAAKGNTQKRQSTALTGQLSNQTKSLSNISRDLLNSSI